MKARLYVRNVLDLGLVAEVEIPPFQVLPEILIWGWRYFALADYDNAKDPPGDSPAYIEGCAWAVLPPPRAPAHHDLGTESLKHSLRAMVYCVGHLGTDDTDDITRSYCRCRERAARLFNDDGPLFKAIHDGLGTLRNLALALAVSIGMAEEPGATPEFLADLQRFSEMEPASFEAGLETAASELRALLRGTKWEKTT